MTGLAAPASVPVAAPQTAHLGQTAAFKRDRARTRHRIAGGRLVEDLLIDVGVEGRMETVDHVGEPDLGPQRHNLLAFE